MKSAFLTFILFLLGCIFAALALRVVNSQISALVLIGISLVFFTGSFIRILQWRDQKRNQQFTQWQSPLPRPNSEGTVYGLNPSSEYRVLQEFTDFYGNTFHVGETFRFTTRHFLPYDGGHTLVFEKRMIYLQEEKNKDILENFSAYIEKVQST